MSQYFPEWYRRSIVKVEFDLSTYAMKADPKGATDTSKLASKTNLASLKLK